LPTVEEARKLSKVGENIIVKIPMTAPGLVAVKVLSQHSVRTAVTLVFSPNQAIEGLIWLEPPHCGSITPVVYRKWEIR